MLYPVDNEDIEYEDLDDDDEGNWVDCLDSPTNSDEYTVNEDDSADAGDIYDIEYDR